MLLRQTNSWSLKSWIGPRSEANFPFFRYEFSPFLAYIFGLRSMQGARRIKRFLTRRGAFKEGATLSLVCLTSSFVTSRDFFALPLPTATGSSEFRDTWASNGTLQFLPEVNWRWYLVGFELAFGGDWEGICKGASYLCQLEIGDFPFFCANSMMMEFGMRINLTSRIYEFSSQKTDLGITLKGKGVVFSIPVLLPCHVKPLVLSVRGKERPRPWKVLVGRVERREQPVNRNQVQKSSHLKELASIKERYQLLLLAILSQALYPIDFTFNECFWVIAPKGSHFAQKARLDGNRSHFCLWTRLYSYSFFQE